MTRYTVFPGDFVSLRAAGGKDSRSTRSPVVSREGHGGCVPCGAGLSPFAVNVEIQRRIPAQLSGPAALC